jgi:hypothetical protein
MTEVTPPAARVSAALSGESQKNQIAVEVVELLQNLKRHTVFLQKGDEWEFVRIKQWQEAAPMTQPAPR